MNKPTLKEQAHGEIEKIFRILLPQNGLSVREEQITLCHAMLDTLLKNNIALCDAGVGIGKTYAYLTACILLKKFAPHGPAGSQPVVISTSSVALQDSIIEEYIPFLSRIFLENRVISKPIRAIVRKGKERFVCDARLSQRLEAVKDMAFLPSPQIRHRLGCTGKGVRWSRNRGELLVKIRRSRLVIFTVGFWFNWDPLLFERKKIKRRQFVAGVLSANFS